MSRASRSAVLDWGIPIVLLIATTIPFYRTDIDVRIARHFYVPGVGWPHGAVEPWRFLKHDGVIPAFVLGAGALGFWIASFFAPRFRSARRGALFLVLVLAIGPGFLVNDVFKEHWGRPRPHDLVEFGGQREYVVPLVMSPPEHGTAFPSGHVATAFYLLTPYFLLRRRSRWKAAGVFAGGLVYGSLMGYARMAQGAHFLSDIVWSLGVVYLTGLALFYVLGLSAESR
jgi:membrane-associated PAP2 superfamily phosphatase